MKTILLNEPLNVKFTIELQAFERTCIALKKANFNPQYKDGEKNTDSRLSEVVFTVSVKNLREAMELDIVVRRSLLINI